jgi:S-formylglutathione hydrolase FrmB
VSLLSPALLVVLVVLVLACVTGAVWSWPRLAGPGVRPIAGRIGVLAGVNLSVLLLAFAVLNDQYQFFTEWSDLVATASTQSTTTSAGGDAAVAAAVRVPISHPSVPPARWSVLSGGGDLTTYSVTGSASGVTSQVLVLLPAGYSDPANAHRRYPVLEGFGGYPGAVSQLERAFRMPEALANAQSQHLIGPTIDVFVQPWTPPGRDTECVDGPDARAAGDQVETWAAVDVPTWVHERFRAAVGRGSWATWGVSAGAYCAAMVAMLHPDTFSAAISFAGYAQPSWGNWVPFSPGDPATARYDLVGLARRDPPPTALWLFASQHDNLAYPATTALVAAARPPLSVTAQISPVGGHGYLWWTPWFPAALGWLGRTSPGFSPTA